MAEFIKMSYDYEHSRKGYLIHNIELDKFYESFKAAADDIYGTADGVFKVLSPDFPQNVYRKYHFEWVKEEAGVDYKSPRWIFW